MLKTADIPAVILAAGEGSRLRNKNENIKPLIGINGKPLISFIIDNLIYAGFTKIYIIKREEISFEIVTQMYQNIDIIYINEKQHLGSLYSFYHLRYIKEEMFLCTDCDIITNSEAFNKMVERGKAVLKINNISGVMARVINPTKQDVDMIKTLGSKVISFEKRGVESGERGGYVYLWKKEILKQCKDFMKQGSYSLSAYISFLVQKYNISFMDIEDLWDVDTLNDLVFSERKINEVKNEKSII